MCDWGWAPERPSGFVRAGIVYIPDGLDFTGVDVEDVETELLASLSRPIAVSIQYDDPERFWDVYNLVTGDPERPIAYQALPEMGEN